jgi:N-acetylmuramoyl-L-alanine amidase
MAALSGYKIFVDPGHGGTDPGATSNGVRECDVVLDIGLRLKTKLESLGGTVQMSRTTDTYPSLQSRSAASNAFGAHIFVSVHNNAGGGTGVETWVHDNATANTNLLAKKVNDQLVSALSATDRGVKKAPSGRSGTNIYVIDPANTKGWAILSEVLFIDNATDRAKLTDPVYKQKAADAIATGIVNFVATLPPIA